MIIVIFIGAIYKKNVHTEFSDELYILIFTPGWLPSVELFTDLSYTASGVQTGIATLGKYLENSVKTEHVCTL